MKLFELPRGASSREQGRAHGEAFRPLIAELAAMRLELCITAGRFSTTDEVRAIASAHLPLLAREAPALHDELLGIAEGASVDPDLIVVLNHYTDLRDVAGARTSPSPATPSTEAASRETPHDEAAGDEAAGDEGDECSLVYTASERGVLLGQTWDTHASAAPYVTMLHVPGGVVQPEAWVLSITGCLGMIGMNAAGVAIGINNLTSRDARVGLVWPALIRRALTCRTAEEARRLILATPFGSGHHYFVASPDAAYGFETSGMRHAAVFASESSAVSSSASSASDRGSEASYFVHTNHALDAHIAEVSELRAGSTTLDRYSRLERAREQLPMTPEALWSLLSSHDGYPRSLCTHLGSPARPHDVSTCALIVMNVSSLRIMATSGCAHRTIPHELNLSREGRSPLGRAG